jgi:hypothetical protein
MSFARSTWLTCALVLASACDAGPSEARRLQPQIEPFLDDFASFDRWARRFGLADSAFHSREALREAAFSPLYDERRVMGAWLVREGPDATELRYPDGAPSLPEDGWVRVALAEHELAELYAQRRSMTFAGEAREVTLIRRSRPAPGDATLHVVMAF